METATNYIIFGRDRIEHKVAPARRFEATFTVPAGETDMVVSLTGCTNPKYLYVKAPADSKITFKLGAGTDVLHAVPVAYLSSRTGLGVSQILISNGGLVEVEVTVAAAD